MDKLLPERRSENMRRIRSKGMKPELAVRRLVHRLGYRFRLHNANLPGKPDMTFPRRRKVIFIHGCFWHQHASRRCKIVRIPKSNLEYWQPKLKRNVERDATTQLKLRSLGWKVCVVWECSLRDEQKLATRLKSFLDEQPSTRRKLLNKLVAVA